MKIKIGPYKSWFGPYQAARLLRKVGFSRDFCDWLGDQLPEGPFNFIDRLRPRVISVKIHYYDTWSMDDTLAHIIHPMLIQLQATKHGSPFVDDDDVPEELRSTKAAPKENEYDTDEFHHERWNWVLNEMIYAFGTMLDDNWEDKFFPKEGGIDREGWQKEHSRIDNGFRLFGKYYQALWD